MRVKPALLMMLVMAGLLAACGAWPSPSAPPTATQPPLPTPTRRPTATPTPTPIPYLRVNLDVPASVSPLDPVTLGITLEPPAYPPDVLALVYLSVYDAEGRLFYGPTELHGDAWHFAGPQPLQLPLDAAGDWRVEAKVQATVRITGTRTVTMTVAPVAYRDLSNVLPAGVTLKVPEAFEEVFALGDTWAGGRVWRYRDGEVALWWVPGPTEKLQFQNALVVLEATYDAYQPAVPVAYEDDLLWQDRPAIRFEETWTSKSGEHPGVAWVIQGPNRWLYVLRVRALEGPAIPWLVEQVSNSFRFE